MLASRMPAVRKNDEGKSRGIGGALERGFDAVLRGYGRALKLCFRFHVVVFAVFLGTVALTVYELNANSQRLLPARGYRSAAGVDAGARGHFLRGDDCLTGQGRGRVRQIRLMSRMSAAQLRHRQQRFGGDECRAGISWRS